jgi:hypothetical protein
MVAERRLDEMSAAPLANEAPRQRWREMEGVSPVPPLPQPPSPFTLPPAGTFGGYFAGMFREAKPLGSAM